jgi:phosphoribosylformylglycinamidine synthase subunit PurQ / glutaminase
MSLSRRRVAVVVYPGSNCDHDAYHVLGHVLGAEARFVWHKETTLGDVDAVVLPGGFSYGDYLRAGAIASVSPVMGAVVDFARSGGPVLGICNGFQILVEVGLLPGALLRNGSLRFLHQDVYLKVEQAETRFTRRCRREGPLRMPIAHAEGNFFADSRTLVEIEEDGRVAFRYCDPFGAVSPDANVNGSAHAIAGILNEGGNVLGMMPHPERASEPELGSSDGRGILESLVDSLTEA